MAVGLQAPQKEIVCFHLTLFFDTFFLFFSNCCPDNKKVMALPSRFPIIMTPRLLSSISTLPGIPAHSWYFIAASTLTVLNLPEEIPRVFKSAIGPDATDHEGNIYIARRMREALIKTAAVAGLPKVVSKNHPVYSVICC